jgi:serine/threonine-protein kinase
MSSDFHPMSPERRRQVEEAFEKILDAPREERQRALARIEEEDPDLENAVRSLLGAHYRSEGVLDGPPLISVFAQKTTERPEERVGRYRLLKEIGKGGMGTVFLAERADGHFKQRVALKVIPRADDELRGRVVAERQILASLQHPSIGRLLDGGVTDDGRPFLVMEYVSGLPIDVYCDRMRLSLRERLKLFLTVLGAVQHAHHNLVVHRDLKPSNILVSPSGEVKLLDFGIAKLLNPNLGGADSPVTRVEERALTPEYASPEQVRGEAITTAADVYSLGVVLYELLSGCRPYSIKGRSLPELARTICETDPPAPSECIAGGMENRSRGRGEGPEKIDPVALANERHTTSARLLKALKGDLDAIVMKSLRKEPGRRYTSVEALAQDIRSYLDGHPVGARRGNQWYRIQKTFRRHRTGALAAAVVVVSLLAGAGAAVWQAGIAGRERDRAQAALRESEEVTEFLLGLFDSSHPEESPGGTVTVQDLLKRGQLRADSLVGEPLVRARLLRVMARAHQNLGQYGEAKVLAASAVSILEAEVGADHAELVPALHRFGIALKNDGQYDSARAVLESARAAGEGQQSVDAALLGDILEELARVSIYLGDLSQAEVLANQALAIKEEALGGGAPETLNTLGALASIYRFQGRYDLAEATFRDVLARRRAMVSPDLTTLTGDMLQVADLILRRNGDLDEAEALAREAVTVLQDGSGYGNRNFAWGLTSLAAVREAQGDTEEAESLLNQAVSIRRRTYGDVHPLISESLGELADFLVRAGRPLEAEGHLRAAEEIDLQTVGPSHSRHAGTLSGLGKALMELGRLVEADSVMAISSEIRVAAQGDRALPLAQLLAGRAEIRTRLGRFQEAEEMLKEALAIISSQPGQGIVAHEIHTTFVGLYDAWGRPELAARHRELTGLTR